MPRAAKTAHLFKAFLRIFSLCVFLIPWDTHNAKEGTEFLFQTEKTILITAPKVNTELLGSLKRQHISVAVVSLLEARNEPAVTCSR